MSIYNHSTPRSTVQIPRAPDVSFGVSVQTLALRFGRGRYCVAVADLAEASRLWCIWRDRQNLGASDSPLVTVIDTETGATVARISYNGRVWHPESGKEIVPA